MLKKCGYSIKYVRSVMYTCTFQLYIEFEIVHDIVHCKCNIHCVMCTVKVYILHNTMFRTCPDLNDVLVSPLDGDSPEKTRLYARVLSWTSWLPSDIFNNLVRELALEVPVVTSFHDILFLDVDRNLTLCNFRYPRVILIISSSSNRRRKSEFLDPCRCLKFEVYSKAPTLTIIYGHLLYVLFDADFDGQQLGMM